MEHQVQKDKTQLAELRADLFSRYEAGQMGDDADVFEWNALYKMYIRLVDAIEVPDNQLQE